MGFEVKQGELFGLRFWKSRINTKAETHLALQKLLIKRLNDWGMKLDWFAGIKVGDTLIYPIYNHTNDRTQFVMRIEFHKKYCTGTIIEAV